MGILQQVGAARAAAAASPGLFAATLSYEALTRVRAYMCVSYSRRDYIGVQYGQGYVQESDILRESSRDLL